MIGALVICAALGAQDVRSTEVTYQDLRDGFKDNFRLVDVLRGLSRQPP